MGLKRRVFRLYLLVRAAKLVSSVDAELPLVSAQLRLARSSN